LNYDGTTTSTRLEHRHTFDTLGREVLDSVGSAAYGASVTNYQTTQNYYNQVGQLAGVDVAYGSTAMTSTRYIYDAFSNRVGTKDGIGHVMVDTFDKNNLQTSHNLVRNSNGSEYISGAAGSTATLTKLNTYVYDQAGRKYGEAIYDTAGATGDFQYYKYDERSNIITTRNRLGGLKTFAYDELGNKTSDGEIVTVSYYTFPNGPYGAPVLNSYTTTRPLNGWNYKNAGNDFADFGSQRALTHNVAGITYAYSYDNLGQLVQESGGSSTVTYNYFENGLQKSILESSLSSDGFTSATNTSYCYYDIKNNRTGETNNTGVNVAAHTVPVPYGGTANVAATSYSTGTATTHYKYDSLNRLTSVSSPSTSVSIGGGSYATTNLTSLNYDYDAIGNRRRVSSTYTLQGGFQTSVNEWYSYDAANRVLVEGGTSNGSTAVISPNNPKAVAFAYDGAGRRVSEERWNGTTQPYGSSAGSETYVSKVFTYNDLGLVATLSNRTGTRALGANSSATYVTLSGLAVAETNFYDNRGFKTTTLLNTKDRTLTSVFNKDGTVSSQTTKVTSTGRNESAQDSYQYDTAANVTTYRYVSYDINTVANSTTSYSIYNYSYADTYSGRQVSAISVSSSQSGTAAGNTTNNYDNRGRLSGTAITEYSVANNNTTGMSYRNFTYNASGQIIGKAESKFGDSAGYKTQNYYYFNGSELANLGAISGVDISPLTAVYAGGSTPGSYVVNGGETLMSIAQSLFGDGKLWYLIADANGLHQGPTDAFAKTDIGRGLIVPNNDKNIRNTSSNFKPYNASDIIGDLTPSPTQLPPPKAKGCNVIAMIVIIVVAVVLTVVTAGAFAAVAGPGLAGAFAAGGSVLMGTAAGMTTGAMMAASFVAGVVGSIGSQLVGVALGVQDKVNFRQAAASGFTAAFSAGAGSYLNGMKEGSLLLNTQATATKGMQLTGYGQMARGAASYLGAYASNKIVGLETHFNWTDMAVATVSSGITGKTGNGITDAVGSVGGDFGANFAGNLFGSAVSSSLSRLVGRGQKQDWGAMAADAFGNALATGIVDHYSKPAEFRALSREQQARVRDLADRAGADINNPDALRTLIRASETFSGKEFSTSELLGRTGDYLKLSGASEDQTNEVLDMYIENGLMARRGIVEVETGASLSSPVQKRSQNAFGSTYVDDGLVGAGNVFEKIGQTIESNPAAKYALIALDVAAGPVAYAAREAIANSPIGKFKQKIEEKAADFVAGKMENVGRDTPESQHAGAGAVGLIEMAAGGALAGLKRASGAISKFKARDMESSPSLKGDPYHPDSVEARSAESKRIYGAFDHEAVAKDLGFDKRISPQKAPFNSHGQPVFSNGKKFITPDIDGHNVTNGWKTFDIKGRRTGTWNQDLTERLKK
jgi:hypothetical protein